MDERYLKEHGYKRISDYFDDIKSHYWINDEGKVFSFAKKTQDFLIPSIDEYGYYRQGLAYKDNGNTKHITVHKIVNYIFNGPPPKDLLYPITDHIDGNPSNNYYKNLRWLEASDNTSYDYKHKGLTNIKNEDIPKIFELYKKGMKITDICKLYNTYESNIENILTGRNRKKSIRKI